MKAGEIRDDDPSDFLVISKSHIIANSSLGSATWEYLNFYQLYED